MYYFYIISLLYNNIRLASHICGEMSESIFSDTIAHILFAKGVSHEAICKLTGDLKVSAMIALGYTCSNSKLGVVKFLREQYGLGLADAKYAADVFAELRTDTQRIDMEDALLRKAFANK